MVASMDTKPSYLGLLNAIALGERNGGELFNCWASTTTRSDVRAVLHTVALRESEHALAFEKRLDELGYGLIENPDPTHEGRMAIAMSTTLSDREKAEKLSLVRTSEERQKDIFDTMFHNKDLDPQTGGLLGRYIAEERDTGRLLSGCYGALCEMESAPAPSAKLDDLACQVAEIRSCLTELTASIQALASR